MEETGAEGRPKRLIITEMVLENFKSYAGKQRVGPFHKVHGVTFVGKEATLHTPSGNVF